jgi:HD-GYP domain-containing protein (c-di-GMP phosphodiesterase class II)
MTSPRHYSPQRTIEEALAELVACAGTQFDPEIVTALRSKILEVGLSAPVLEPTFPRVSSAHG